MSAVAVADALRDHGVPLVLCSGWDRRGRPWQHGVPTGVTQHNTATPSATGPTGRPSLSWCMNLDGSYPFANILTARGPASVEGLSGTGGSPTAAVAFLMSALSAWHCGKGGPSPLLRADADLGHLTLLGVEHDARQVAPGQPGALTAAQVETGARIGAAIADLSGAGTKVIHTHTCWCSCCHDVGAYPGAHLARKDDTWGDRPDSGPSAAFSAPWWRAQAVPYLTPGTPTPTPQQPAQEDDVMVLIHGRTPYLLSGGRLCRISDVTRQKLQGAGVPVAGVDSADWDRLVEAYGSSSMRGDV